jgi:2,3-bisphosphoglycerate-independent phosphoglycerate mutase
MKSVMIIIDGLGDEPLSELGGRTPLEAAFIPNMHYIANRGRVGSIKTTFPGFPIESMVCIMGLLGYEPEQYYPSGRAGFEAMAKGLPLTRLWPFRNRPSADQARTGRHRPEIW